MNWKEFGMKPSWFNSGAVPTLPGGTQENLRQNSQCPVQNGIKKLLNKSLHITLLLHQTAWCKHCHML